MRVTQDRVPEPLHQGPFLGKVVLRNAPEVLAVDVQDRRHEAVALGLNLGVHEKGQSTIARRLEAWMHESFSLPVP